MIRWCASCNSSRLLQLMARLLQLLTPHELKLPMLLCQPSFHLQCHHSSCSDDSIGGGISQGCPQIDAKLLLLEALLTAATAAVVPVLQSSHDRM